MMKKWLTILSLVILSATFGACQSSGNVAVGDVPPCARACLSNSTAYATDCAQIDVKCLCSSSNYVSALSCCLSQNCNTTEQQTAIQFNVQECAAVNTSAPNFVGCSPFSLSKGSGGSGQATTSSANSMNSLVSTINGETVTEPGAYAQTNLVTATFAGKPLLTGSCSVPLFAQVIISAASVLEFPQIGCGTNRENCCPFGIGENAVLTVCPQDYFTTSGGCCPLGFQLETTGVGIETPCYSSPSVTLLPASSPTMSSVILITDRVLARRYILATATKPALGTGTIVGIAVGSTAFTMIVLITAWCIRRRKGSNSKQSSGPTTTYPPVEPTLAPMNEVQSIQELASPSSNLQTPTTPRASNWALSPPGSSPPAYDSTKGRPISLKTAIPQELPGSIHMHEHHPAFTGSQSEVSLVSAPKTPIQSAPGSVRSPVLSPSSPLRTTSPTTMPVKPSGSPRFREGTM